MLCERVEALMNRLSGLADALEHTRTAYNGASIFQMTGDFTGQSLDLDQAPQPDNADVPMFESDESSDIGENESDDSSEDSACFTPSFLQDDNLAVDSYGRFRYIGGAPNTLMIEAVRATSTVAESPEELAISNVAACATSSPMRGKCTTAPLPFFTPGIVWPSLPYLPQPSQVPLPPRYIADVLVNIFFDQIHCTFPTLFRPQFMEQYYILMAGGPDSNTNPDFLSVFFSVCALSTSLMDHGSGQRFSGIEFYEKAVVLHYAGTGRSSMERVQSLSLLSLCAARWNILAQSWMFAGQAVRAAQDFGLHVGLVSFLHLDRCNGIL